MLNSFLCLQNLLPCQSNKRIPSLLFFPLLSCHIRHSACLFYPLSVSLCCCLLSMFFLFMLFLWLLLPCLFVKKGITRAAAQPDDCASKYSRNLLGYKLYLLCSQLMSLLMLCVCILSVHKLTGARERQTETETEIEETRKAERASKTDIIISSHLPDGRMTLPSDAT